MGRGQEGEEETKEASGKGAREGVFTGELLKKIF